MYSVSLKSLPYMLFFGTNIHKGLILASLLLMKYLKPFLPKETLLDTTLLLISTFFIEIGLLC